MAPETHEPLEMNPVVREKWIAALLSGEYKKGIGSLHKRLDRTLHKLRKGDTGDRWCCLGVLCDLAVKEGVPVEVREWRGTFNYDRSAEFLPAAVRQWAGLLSENPRAYGHPLADHNDGFGAHPNGRSFRTVAAMIGGTYKGRV